MNKFFDLINEEKQRILKINNGRWFIIGFIPFQYCEKSKTLNTSNRVHSSVLEILKKNGVNLTSIRPLIEVKEGVKDKDKDKDKDKRRSLRGREGGEKLTYTKKNIQDNP